MCSEQKINCKGCVALFTRAWIEIDLTQVECAKIAVALFTRAWIEIIDDLTIFNYKAVALFTRAWIEIVELCILIPQMGCRPLHEGVD